ncbi:multicopper oxidase domain-containing protein [Candidatus Dependentiae bacterium]|nr:multicopper oxidase domain-containing protein [Candidatus Dependentiae bacterium]
MNKKIFTYLALFANISLFCQEHQDHKKIEHSVVEKKLHAKKHHVMPRLTYSWDNPKIKPSAPPPLTGKQMGVIETIGIPPLGYDMDGNVKVFKLFAQPIEQYITDGKDADYEKLIKEKNKVPAGIVHHRHIVQKIRAWGFNGTTPGPTIEVNEGDRIRLVIKNELPEPLSVHSHGIELPNDQDGEGGFAEPVIMPGQTRNYEYTLYQSGTAFYHGEFNLMKLTSYGLTGAIIIHPKKYEYKVDKQFVITLQEWRILPGNLDPDLVSMDFNWFTFNGKSAPSIPTITVNQGDRVRIRLINMSMDNHPIHMHGHTWWQVGTEGGPIPKSAQWPGNTVDVPPGGSRDVEFIAWNPGLWFFHCHKVHHVINAHADVPMGVMSHGGMFTIVNVIPKDPNAKWQHPKERGEDVSSRDFSYDKKEETK